MAHKDHVPEKGIAGGLATLDGSALVPLAQLAVMVGASGVSNGAAGLVPQPLIADAAGFLRGDATYQTLPAGGQFGADFAFSEQTVFAGNSTVNFVNFDTLNFTNTSGVTANFLIGWFYVWSHNNNQTDFIARVQYDTTTALIDPGDTGIQRQEPKDSAGSGAGGTDQRYPCAGFRIIPVGAGAHTVDLDFRTSSNGNASNLYHSVMFAMRVQ